MKVNAVFDNVKIYDVQDRLDVLKGESFTLEILEELPDEFEVFTNNDPVLELGDDDRTVTANVLGESKIRFMVGIQVIKDLLIVVVDKVALQAVSLNASLGSPVKK